jgi:Arc/MetJ-type ribon-helix-helix transcriptional regulator
VSDFGTILAAKGSRAVPTKHALNVSLTEQLRDFVEEQVRSGRFQTASEVVRSGLRLLQDNLRGSPGGRGQGATDGEGLAKEKPQQPLAEVRRVAP